MENSNEDHTKAHACSTYMYVQCTSVEQVKRVGMESVPGDSPASTGLPTH